MKPGQTLRVWFGFAALLFILALNQAVVAAPANSPIQVKIDTAQATPRQVEEPTQQAILRDYAKAWSDLEQAVASNHSDLLDASFVGYARKKWGAAVADQARAGVSRKVVDRGHRLQVVFYSVEGSAMELRDSAQLEIQYLDGGKVLHSERVTAHYVVLMTPAENSWKVRLLQEVPSEAPQQEAFFGVSAVRGGF